MTHHRPRLRRLLAWAALAAALLLALVTAALLGAALDPFPGNVQLSVDGEAIDLHALHTGHWLLAAVGVVLATLVVLLVMPLALLLGVAMPLALAGFGLLAATALAVALLGLLGSPFILLGLLVWWAARPARAAGPGAAAARPPVPLVGQYTDNTTPLA